MIIFKIIFDIGSQKAKTRDIANILKPEFQLEIVARTLFYHQNDGMLLRVFCHANDECNFIDWT